MPCNNSVIRQFKLLSFKYFKSVKFFPQPHLPILSSTFCNRTSSRLFTKINPCVPCGNFHTSNICFESDLPEEDPSKPLVKLTFIKVDGEEVEIKGRVGLTVMQEAVKNKLPIEAACDGQLACTTCHVYVEDCTKNGAISSEADNEYLMNKSVEEEDMLDSAAFVKPNSRLACQLFISPDCENVRFRLPAATINFSVDKKKDENSS